MSTRPRLDVAWDDQRAFPAVIDGGSLPEAARRLGLSQPTVRARIAALEAALGGALFTCAVNGTVLAKQALALACHVRAMQRASEAHLADRGTPKTIADLYHQYLTGPDRSRDDLVLAARAMPDLPPERFVLRTDSHPAQLAAIRAGLGIGGVQVPVAMQSDNLVRLLRELQLEALEMWIVMHEDL